jgi:hypothetical protein
LQLGDIFGAPTIIESAHERSIVIDRPLRKNLATKKKLRHQPW